MRHGWVSGLLTPLGLAVGALARLKRLAYTRGWQSSEDCGVPVVVVGNLVAGGAGKTPTVLALAEALRQAGHRPGIVSRGHGRRDTTRGDVLHVQEDTPAQIAGDEPLLLRRRSGLPVVIGRDRVAAARALLSSEPSLTVILSDDGLQHRRLARAIEVIVFDERGAGNGRCLPAGPLREPMPAAPPPGAVVIYNAAAPTTPWPGRPLQRRLAGAVSLPDWWAGQEASRDALLALGGRPLIAAAGTARPERFFESLKAAGLAFTALPLPDHHAFDALPWPAGPCDVIVTEKDAVKLIGRPLDGARIWVAPLDCRLDPIDVATILARLPQPGSRPRALGRPA